MKVNQKYARFNRGEISPLAMSREDVDGIVDCAEVFTNLTPFRLGPMAYRPGSEFLGAVSGLSYFLDFMFDRNTKAELEFTDLAMRIWESDSLITRPSTSTTVSNGTFDTDLSSWTDDDQGTAVSDWKINGYMSLIGDGASEARRYQTLTADTTNETGLRITVTDAPIYLRLGYSVGGTDIFEGQLDPGVHSLAFTATAAAVTVQVSNREKYEALVDSVEIESAGVVSLPHSIPESALSLIRFRQSADVLFCAVKDYMQFKVERRAPRSWSLVEYETQDGPFGSINTTPITMTVTAISGDTTLTSSEDFFDSDRHVGTLIRHDSVGQFVSQAISGEGQFTDPIQVTGIDDTRHFNLTIPSGLTGTTVTLQRSVGAPGSWDDFRTYTTVQSNILIDDNLDNVIMYYRLGVKTGDFGSGSATIELNYEAGSITGYAKITAVNSPTEAAIKIYKDFGSTDASPNWYQGEWGGDENGWPSAVSIYEGRLNWHGKNASWHSVSDNFYSYDDTIEGDSKAFKRTIGFGPVDSVMWALDSSRLIIGTAGSEIALRSTTRNEALTATTANFKEIDNQGSAEIDLAKIGRSGFYVEHSGIRINEIMLDGETEYQVFDLMTLHPEIASSGIKKIVVQQQPEKVLHAVLNNGTVVLNMKDSSEGIRSWHRYTMDGNIEDAVINRGNDEDEVYYVVNRTGGRYLEKFAKRTEARGGNMSKHYDSFVTYSSPATATLTGLDHLNGKTVGVWADGQDRGDYAVASGSITVDSATYTDICVGLRYVGKWQSVPLVAYSNRGSTANANKRVTEIGLRMLWAVPGLVKYGADFDDLYDMPSVENGDVYNKDVVMNVYHEEMLEFDGDWDPNSRICLQATGPVTFAHLQYTVQADR